MQTQVCTLYVITDCYDLMTKALSSVETIVFVNGIKYQTHTPFM